MPAFALSWNKSPRKIVREINSHFGRLLSLVGNKRAAQHHPRYKTSIPSLFPDASLYWRGILSATNPLWAILPTIRKAFLYAPPCAPFPSGLNRLPALTPEGLSFRAPPFKSARLQLKTFHIAPRNFGNFFRRDKAHYALKIPLKKRAARSRL